MTEPDRHPDMTTIFSEEWREAVRRWHDHKETCEECGAAEATRDFCLDGARLFRKVVSGP
jgi:hypothetical protein